MIYTILLLEDVYNDQVITLDKSGNQYTVGLKNYENGEYTHKTYSEMDEALAVVQKFTAAFAKGDYSYETRKSWLA